MLLPWYLFVSKDMNQKQYFKENGRPLLMDYLNLELEKKVLTEVLSLASNQLIISLSPGEDSC